MEGICLGEGGQRIHKVGEEGGWGEGLLRNLTEWRGQRIHKVGQESG